jgi:PQQ-dependent dehydrogenase (methanol/ethanol family)
MKGIRALFVLALGCAVLVAALTASASTRQITPIPAFSAKDLTAEPGNDWVTARGDIYNRQYSSLDAINKGNVSKLKVAWHTRVAVPTKGKPNFTGVFAEAEPVVYKGTMYMPDSKGNVFAFDAVTGERLWYYKPKFPKGFSAPLPTSRGVVIGDGKVFMAQTDGNIVGLDQGTGRVAWKQTVGNYKLGYFFTSPPTYFNGMLVVGQSGGDFGADSKVVGLDAKTGAVKWQFNVIPTGSNVGADSWPKKRAFQGGGAVWAQLSVDPELKLVYVGVGNPVPYNGNVRGKGQELFTESVVALNVETGKYAWHYQTVHHDIWDYDAAANPLVLFDLQINGQMRHAVASIGKTGWVYILDRKTGKPVIGINEKKVPQAPSQHTWPTQPIPVGEPFAAQCPHNQAAWKKWKAPDGKPVKIGCIFTPYNEKQYTVFAPAALGGADWPPSSYSSKTGYLYICSKDSAAAWKALPEGHAHEQACLGGEIPGRRHVLQRCDVNGRRARVRRSERHHAAGLRRLDGQAPLDVAQAECERRGAADDLHGQRQAVRRGLRRRERHCVRLRDRQAEVRLGPLHVRAAVLAASVGKGRLAPALPRSHRGARPSARAPTRQAKLVASNRTSTSSTRDSSGRV